MYFTIYNLTHFSFIKWLTGFYCPNYVINLNNSFRFGIETRSICIQQHNTFEKKKKNYLTFMRSKEVIYVGCSKSNAFYLFPWKQMTDTKSAITLLYRPTFSTKMRYCHLYPARIQSTPSEFCILQNIGSCEEL